MHFALSFSLIISFLCITQGRPPLDERTFTSEVVDESLDALVAKMSDPDLATLTYNCLPNTLDTTVFYYSFPTSSRRVSPKRFPERRFVLSDSTKDDTFIITGDITAMWLRDSTNQVQPYLRYLTEDPSLQSLIKGLLNRQVASILLDPYANAFNLNADGSGGDHQEDSTTKPSYLGTRVSAMNSKIWERKYELDSLCAVLKLSSGYYSATKDLSGFDEDWFSAVELIYDTMVEQQKTWVEESSNPSGPQYKFQRETTEPGDTLLHATGHPSSKTGLVKSGFRPSDDACLFPYNIPANAMAVVTLEQTSQIIKNNWPSDFEKQLLATNLQQLANQIRSAINTYGIIQHPVHGKIYAYEVDGYGNYYIADDANVPSLLSLPYLGYLSENDSVYLNTRRVILSSSNPWFFSGSAGEGIGGPHNGVGWIWPMSIIIRALTSDNDTEISLLLDLIKDSSAGTDYLHESFWLDSVNTYTRSWFAWTNSLFGELILKLADEKPYLIF